MTDKIFMTEYINSFWRPTDDLMAAFRKECEEDNIPVILIETEMVLRSLLALQHPHTILEIGTGTGYSACFMAKALGGDVRITTIEQDFERFGKANMNVEKQNCEDFVHLICDDAVHALKQLKDGRRMFDLVFIDAAKSHYREFWDEVMAMVHRGSVIICDNIMMRGSTLTPAEESPHKHRTNVRNMRDFLEYITSYDKVDTAITAAGDGMSISCVK